MTDADLVLGRLDTERFASGRMQLDREAAAAALARLGSKLGLDAEATAAATVRLVDAHMTDAIRRVLSLAGADPRRLDLVAFGGMGGVHATTQAAALGMRRVLVPSAAPGLSALGLLTADHVIDDSRGYIVPWQEADARQLSRLAGELEDRARPSRQCRGSGRADPSRVVDPSRLSRADLRRRHTGGRPDQCKRGGRRIPPPQRGSPPH